MRRRVLVLCGGRSAERDISCISAAAILRNLDPRRWEPALVRIDPEGRWTWQADPLAFARHPKPWRFAFAKTPARLELAPPSGLRVGSRLLPVAVVIPALHGPYGEDGTMQGLLEVSGLAFVGCDTLGSAVGMDKVMSKRLARWEGLPVLPYAVLSSPRELGGAKGLRLPVFVKPSRMGSSVGVSKVRTWSELKGAVEKAFRFDTTVLVEQGVEPREVECAVLGGGDKVAASVIGEIRPNADFYSYEAKYLDPEGATLTVPAELPAAKARLVQALAVRAFRVLGCHGLARVDFLLDKKTGKVWFNEVNTFPGFTSASMYPKLWEASGLPFPKLVDRLIALALERRRARAALSVTRA